MALLAIQFGLQPSLTRRFTPAGINRSSVILVQECLKFLFAAGMLRLSCTNAQLRDLRQKWSVGQWFQVAAVPSALYAVQNVAALTAYQHLDALTFNVLNQTKTLSAALCCYLIMGRSQSVMQIVALLLLLVSALVMERIIPIQDFGNSSSWSWLWNTDTNNTVHWTHGVAPILLASFISGLAGALSQKNLQSSNGTTGRNPYQFSMELCAASAILLAIQLLVTAATNVANAHNINKDNNTIGSMWDGWTLTTWIPIATNAAGGIVVGLVTKYAGSVQKGFALIFGILLSGLLQEFSAGRGSVRPEQVMGGLLAAISLYIHATNPPITTKSQSKPPPSIKKEGNGNLKKTN